MTLPATTPGAAIEEPISKRDFMLGELAAEVRGLYALRTQEQAEFRQVMGELGERVDALSDNTRVLATQHQANLDASRETTKASKELVGAVSALRLDLQRSAAATEARFVALESLADSARRERDGIVETVAAVKNDVKTLMDERTAKKTVDTARKDWWERFWIRTKNVALIVGIPAVFGGAVAAVDRLWDRFSGGEPAVVDEDGVGDADDDRPSMAGW